MVESMLQCLCLFLLCPFCRQQTSFSRDVNSALPTRSLILYYIGGRGGGWRREEKASVQHEKVLFCLVFLTLRGAGLEAYTNYISF